MGTVFEIRVTVFLRLSMARMKAFLGGSCGNGGGGFLVGIEEELCGLLGRMCMAGRRGSLGDWGNRRADDGAEVWRRTKKDEGGE